MRLLLILLLTLAIAPTLVSAESYTAYQASAVKVIDGDTLKLDVAT